MTGSTDTSLWTVYKKGLRNYCGNVLPDGAFCNQHIHFNILFYEQIVNFLFFVFFLMICQNVLDLVKNQKLPENILTPTTKAADHDVPVTPDEVHSFLKTLVNLFTVMVIAIVQIRFLLLL